MIIDNDTVVFRDAQTAFNDAIACGRLSAQPQAENFAGRFMYMCTFNGRDMFKHIDTRSYLPMTVETFPCCGNRVSRPCVRRP